MRRSRAASASSALGRLPNSRIAKSYSGPKRERNCLERRSRARYHANIAITAMAMTIRTMPVIDISRYLTPDNADEGPRELSRSAQNGLKLTSRGSSRAHPLQRQTDACIVRRLTDSGEFCEEFAIVQNDRRLLQVKHL